MSTPAISSIAASRETIAFCFDNASAPSAIVIENTAGIATWDRRDEQDQHELQDVQRVGEPPVIGRSRCHDKRGKATLIAASTHGDDDQEVADLEHLPLAMADARPGHELGGAAEHVLRRLR